MIKILDNGDLVGVDNKAIYPAINIWYRPDGRVMTIESYLRKKHTDGIWYLQRFYREFTNEPSALKNMELTFVGRFNYEVYLAILFGVVDLNLTLMVRNGSQEPAFIKDDDQRDEAERLNIGLLRQVNGVPAEISHGLVKVKITGCVNDPHSWYTNKIGEEFWVFQQAKGYDSNYWSLINSENIIYKIDCEVIKVI